MLKVNGLETQFITSDGPAHAVHGISFSFNNRETVGLEGESGCGKRVTMMNVLRLLPSPTAKVATGTALFNGRDLLSMSPDEIRCVRGPKSLLSSGSDDFN